MAGSVFVALFVSVVALAVGGLALVGCVYVYMDCLRSKRSEAHETKPTPSPHMVSEVQEREFRVFSRAWKYLQAVVWKLKAAVHEAGKRSLHVCLEEALPAIKRLHRFFEANRIFFRGDLLDAFGRVDAVLVRILADHDRQAIGCDKLMEYLRAIEAEQSKIEHLIRRRLPLL